jgi:nucleotide-binding universal stress UspA family protein
MTASMTVDRANDSAAIRRVLLATDLSDASALATDRALEIAEALRAGLLVVSVIDPGGRRPAGALRVDQERSIREGRVADLVARARRRKIATEYMIWTGDPADSIVEAAAAEGADLIAIGSQGRSGLGRAILGSVSDHVVRHAPCPVMVVRGVDGRGRQPPAETAPS